MTIPARMAMIPTTRRISRRVKAFLEFFILKIIIKFIFIKDISIIPPPTALWQENGYLKLIFN
jgi:hypothetical protein